MKKQNDGYGFFRRAVSSLNWKLYDIRSKIYNKRKKDAPRKARSITQMNNGKKIFCATMLFLPLLQFFLFYVCVNFNSILLAFQRIDADGNRFLVKFDNFAAIFEKFRTEAVFGYAIKNSLISYIFTTVIASPVGLLFAFYIYKKATLGKFFKITLFLPSVVSSIVLVMLYMYFVDLALPTIIKEVFKTKVSGFFSNLDTQFATIVVFTVFTSFGSSVLMYLSSMNGINESIVEAAELDGATYFQEFIYVTFPMVYPTFVTFFIIGISGIFTNQMNLVSFLGTDRPMPQSQTFGYYLYQQTVAGEANYPLLSAFGLMITLVVAPVSIITKKLMEKYGPSAEQAPVRRAK